ncbi:MAG: sugar nucleotide-binding protein [Verrucomicrobiota bacterium]|nr:sugar nucleotide-binding protein [Verrucomicrobiota bacterium]
MILLLGASGYIGSALAQELKRRGTAFVPLARSELDYTRFDVLFPFLESRRPEFVINAAGYTGKPNVDACETARADTLAGNTLLPQTIVQACAALKIPWGHVSSGCIFSGAKIVASGSTRVEKDLTRPDLRALADRSPDCIRGFSESDTPNFSFRDPPCSFYSASKALAEEAVSGLGQGYLWRLRIPFDEFDNTRNYLSKLQRYPKIYDNVNSISHRGDFARAALDLWERRAPFGVYNVTNPGFVTTRQVVALVEKRLRPKRIFEFWTNDAEFYKLGARTPRSNCVLDVAKLLATGVKMRPVVEALEDSLKNWKPE